MSDDGEKTRLVKEEKSGTADNRISKNRQAIETKQETFSSKSFVKDTNSRQKLLLLNFALVRFFENFCAGFPSPFLARIVTQKGGTLLEATIIFQIRLVALVISCPIFGHFYQRIGSKCMIICSLIVTAICQCLFSTLEYLNNMSVLVAIGISTRCVYGIGNAAMFLAMSTITCQEFPNFISTAYGIFISAASCGNLFGSALGGVLYDKFGMFYPVLISGILLFLLVPPQFVLLKRYSDDRKVGSSFKLVQVLRNPRFVTTILAASTRYAVIGYFAVALTLYLKNRYNTSVVGVALGLEGIAFGLSSILVGYLASKLPNYRRFSISLAGIFFSSAIFVFTPNQALVGVYIASALLGVFGSGVNVASFGEIMAIAQRDSTDPDVAVSSSVTSIWLTVTSLVMFLVPSIASLVQSFVKSSFTKAMFSLSILNLTCAILQGIFAIFWKR